ncbi:C39 family peptidase [Gordonia sp. (in: high G+C Gram-positive bacteria)]|uniref:C39 family peptidase n=1 Tax=Gordonia sp. (in: high G+C Gram-positive bacteria) TaxID=84139 RepID=UPI0039E3218F
MTQIILPHKYHAQLTGWTCGPSTAKVVLSTFGIDVTEQQMATACHTTQDGTPDIVNVLAAVNARAGARYSPAYIKTPTPTAADVEALRSRLYETVVQNRRAMPVNIWAQAPTQPPGYPSNLIMHYVTDVGVEVDETRRDAKGYPYVTRAYISDSARFSGIEHWWMPVEKLAINITPKGYGTLPAVAAPPADPIIEALVQLVGPKAYDGWPQLGGRTLVDALGELLKTAGVS